MLTFDAGSRTSANSSTANQASAAIGGLSAHTAGKLVVLAVAVDNNQTTDGDEGAVSSVTDNSGGGHTWSKAGEWCNGQGAAQAGATISCWWTVLQASLDGATVTANFTNSTSRDKSVLYMFSVTFTGTGIQLSGTPAGLSNDGADPGSLNVTTDNVECFRIRWVAAESNSTTNLTATDGTWTVLTTAQTSGGSSATNQAIRGEWKISTGTGDASDPTLFSADHASLYVAFKEIAAVFNPQKRNQLIHNKRAISRASVY